MDIGIIARRYARALLLFACENGHETLVYEQAQQLLFQYNQLPEFRHTIENPMVSRTEKIKLLHNATAGADTCEELTKFFYLLLEKRREKLLAFILHSFLFLYRKKKKIRQGKQEKLFHEVIFQIGNSKDMAVGTCHGNAATGGNPQRAESAHPETLSGTHGGIQHQGRPRHHRWRHSGNRLLANRRQHSRTVETREETVHREKQKNRIMKRKQEYAR